MYFKDKLVLKTHFKLDKKYFSSYRFQLETYKIKSGDSEWLRFPSVCKNLLYIDRNDTPWSQMADNVNFRRFSLNMKISDIWHTAKYICVKRELIQIYSWAAWKKQKSKHNFSCSNESRMLYKPLTLIIIITKGKWVCKGGI